MARRRKADLIDRRASGLSIYTRIEVPDARKMAFDLIRDSGIPEPQIGGVFDDINWGIVFYRLHTRTQSPRLGDQNVELSELRRRAEALIQSLNYLSINSKSRVNLASRIKKQQHGVSMDIKISGIEWDNLTEKLITLALRAQTALATKPTDRGGRIQREYLHDLWVSIGAAWLRRLPTAKVVTKSGESHRGPLIELVKGILALEGINTGSPANLGRELYKIKDRIKTAAARERQGDTARFIPRNLNEILLMNTSRRVRNRH